MTTKQLTVTSALPATPEVNEEHSGRSASPETKQPRATADMTTGIYNYGQGYSAYYPRKFDRKNDLAKTPPSMKRQRRWRRYGLCGRGLSLFRPIGGCLRYGHGRSGVYHVCNDTLPYFVRSSSVRPVGFNKISVAYAAVVPAVPASVRRSSCRKRQRSPLPAQQQSRGQIDVTKGRIRLNLYAYPDGFLTFLDGYFTRTGSDISTYDDDGVGQTEKRLSAISEEDVCPLCGGSVDRTALLTTKIAGRWNNTLLQVVPLWRKSGERNSMSFFFQNSFRFACTSPL